MSTTKQLATNSTRLPDLFGRFTTQLWYMLFPAGFFFTFIVVYRPFGSAELLDMGRSLFFFNTAIMMCIVLLTNIVTRLIYYLLYNYVKHTWWEYMGFCFIEMVIMTYFLALYLFLMRHDGRIYFEYVGICTQYSFLVMLFPYFGITIVCALVARISGGYSEQSRLIRFSDTSRQVKAVVDSSSILYIEAKDNYVVIHYLDNDKVKDYQLRNTMNAIAPLVEPHNLFRCQRSYYVNLSHITALRKDPNDMISAELDAGDIVIPVSRKVYRDLSAKL
ncbi:MAG: LytTR family transcriptional regulator [Bacteroidales bacterium]|nr:LytTR family transcriptional regulator [Bacteroidales bacterium]